MLVNPGAHRRTTLLGAAAAATVAVASGALALRADSPGTTLVCAGLTALALLGALALRLGRPEVAVLSAVLSLLPVGVYLLGSPGWCAIIGFGSVVMLLAALRRATEGVV